MRKFAITSLILLFLVQLGCITFPTSRYFAPPETVENVASHIVSIAAYFFMPESEYFNRLKTGLPPSAYTIDTNQTYKGQPIKIIAYIGSGTVVRDNYIVTVRHLFAHDQNTYQMKIWVMKEGVDHPIAADLIAISEGKDDSDDYAVIKTTEDLGMPGIKIAKEHAKRGEKVMFGCSLGGSAFFLRFGVLSHFQYFFQRGNDGQLHLTRFVAFAYNTVQPSGPGDSGSGVFNTNGELVGIVYLGLNIYEEMYAFANPISMLHDFLGEHNLGWLVN